MIFPSAPQGPEDASDGRDSASYRREMRAVASALDRENAAKMAQLQARLNAGDLPGPWARQRADGGAQDAISDLLDQIDSDPLTRYEAGQDAARKAMGRPPLDRHPGDALRYMAQQAADSDDPRIKLDWLHGVRHEGPP